MRTIVHICVPEKFIPPFIELIKENFDFNRHFFLIGKKAPWLRDQPNNVINNSGLVRKFIHLIRLYKCNKIFLHGLYDSHTLYLLWLQPWLLKKCYWLIWGDDLYQYLTPPRGYRRKIKEIIRASLIRRFGHIVTYIHGDYELARKWYGAEGAWHECLMYESNIFQDTTPACHLGDGKIRIMVGNSAYPRNNHIDALDRIASCINDSAVIYAPLSYGPRKEAKRVAEHGTRLFGDRFVPLMDFMPFDEYKRILNDVDIGVFNQDRQQAMGNMITLLGMGKTLYMKPNTSSWEFFSSIGLVIKNIHEFDMTLLDRKSISNNIELTRRYFSKQTLISQYNAAFN